MEIDVLKFLKERLEKPSTPLFYPHPLKRKLMWRLYCLKMWKEHTLSGKEVYRGIFLSQQKKRDVDGKIMSSIKEKCNKIFFSAGLYEQPSCCLWGRPFYPEPSSDMLESWFTTFSLLSLIIGGDQYHAKKYLNGKSVVIDAGANIGIFSMLAARLVPKGKIIAFEPWTRAFAVLMRNTYSYSNIKTERIALGKNKSEFAKLIVDDKSAISASMVDSGIADSTFTSAETVPTTSIDDYVTENEIEHIDFIKIDVEGYESRVIEGATRTIRRDLPVIVMSAYHKPYDVKELSSQIVKIDRRYKVQLSRNIETDLICKI